MTTLGSSALIESRSHAEQLLSTVPGSSVRVMADTHAVIRTRVQELQDSLLGRTVTGVKLDDRSDLVVIRCSPTGESGEATYFCFEASGFADAAAIWPELP